MTENKLTSVLLQLADLGVRGIKIYYDGGGDSGAIEQIICTTEEYQTPEELDDKLDMWDRNVTALCDVDRNLEYAISDFAENQILTDIEDWWNNDGGFGYMSILVPSGKYYINNEVRFTNTETYTHNGDLLSKTEED
jgi:hypothetical protein